MKPALEVESGAWEPIRIHACYLSCARVIRAIRVLARHRERDAAIDETTRTRRTAATRKVESANTEERDA